MLSLVMRQHKILIREKPMFPMRQNDQLNDFPRFFFGGGGICLCLPFVFGKDGRQVEPSLDLAQVLLLALVVWSSPLAEVHSLKERTFQHPFR